MTFSIVEWLRGWDALGHPIAVNFRGNESHQTIFGAVLTIAVKAMTLAFAINTIKDLWTMADPKIQIYEQILSKEQQKEISPMKFSALDFQLAMLTHFNGDVKKIPQKYGRFVMQID